MARPLRSDPPRPPSVPPSVPPSEPRLWTAARLEGPQPVAGPLLRANDFLRLLIAHLDVGVIACDAEGRLLVYSSLLSQPHDQPDEGAPLDRWMTQFTFYLEDGTTPLAREDTPILRALRGEVVRGYQYSVRTNGGELRHRRAHGGPILDAAGNLLGAVVTLHDITDELAAKRELERRAALDALTGLPNRTRFRDVLRAALRDAGSEGVGVAVVLIGVDHFKLVNDGLGHNAGDYVLRELGSRLERCVGSADYAAHFAGDEFVVLVRRVWSATQAEAEATRLRAAVGAPIQLEATPTHVSTSAGVAWAAPGEAGADELIESAHLALGIAKARGRARHVLFDDEVAAAVRRRTAVHAVLSTALDEQRLGLALQPIVRSGSHELVGVEALARLSDARGLPIAPSEFVPVAEQTDLISRVDAWVLERACAVLHGASDSVYVSCNLSAWSLARPDLDRWVLSALERSGLGPSRLCIEMTESMLIGATPTTLKALERLRDAGVRVGLDDFGTGFSSLTYLRDFPVSFVKVDKSFVRGEEDLMSRAIVEAVVRLSHGLGLDVTAEGVEEPSQAEWLQKIGCDQLQGFLFGRPVPPETLIQRWSPPTAR